MVRLFEAHVRLQSEAVIIDLQGEINAAADANLNKAYAEAEQSTQELIVLNFREVDYINSTGIALIVGLLAQARKTHRRLVVYGLSEHYQEIFRITRLADFMQMYADEESALKGSK